jgi:predicted nucleic acid-binding protein
MKIAVTDANIFIDLIRLEILEYLFRLELDLHTTLNVVHELKADQYDIVKPFIKDKSIDIHSLTEEEIIEITTKNYSKKLSPQDLSVIILALKLNAEVLTGDNLLRKYCQKERLEVHGILWIFNLLVEKELIPRNLAFVKLELLISQNNRLPKDECNKRLNDWSL